MHENINAIVLKADTCLRRSSLTEQVHVKRQPYVLCSSSSSTPDLSERVVPALRRLQIQDVVSV